MSGVFGEFSFGQLIPSVLHPGGMVLVSLSCALAWILWNFSTVVARSLARVCLHIVPQSFLSVGLRTFFYFL